MHAPVCTVERVDRRLSTGTNHEASANVHLGSQNSRYLGPKCTFALSGGGSSVRSRSGGGALEEGLDAVAEFAGHLVGSVAGAVDGQVPGSGVRDFTPAERLLERGEPCPLVVGLVGRGHTPQVHVLQALLL